MSNSIMMRVQILLIALCLKGCASAPESFVSSPKVDLQNVQVVGLSFDSQTFLLSFDVENPNPFPLPIQNIDYGLRLNGQPFASGATASNFTVPADGDAQFAISVDLNLFHTAPQLLSIVRDAVRQEIAYELDGKLGVDIPFAPPIKYTNHGTIRVNADTF
jgi:LEA14-like dessication related protein